MKNYKQTASDVLRLVGGEKNVVQVEHCSTRLRFTLADTSKVDAAALKKTAGVMGVISSGPQCQVVIGNDVIEVYDELLKLGTFNAGQAAAPAGIRRRSGRCPQGQKRDRRHYSGLHGRHLPAAGPRHCRCRRSEGSDGAAEHSGPDEQRRYRL